MKENEMMEMTNELYDRLMKLPSYAALEREPAMGNVS